MSGFGLPLVRDASGRRLAKREDDLSLFELRQAGCDARAIVSWVARGAGMEAPERATASELAASFSMARLPRESVYVTPEVIGALRAAR